MQCRSTSLGSELREERSHFGWLMLFDVLFVGSCWFMVVISSSHVISILLVGSVLLQVTELLVTLPTLRPCALARRSWVLDIKTMRLTIKTPAEEFYTNV